MGMGQQGPQAAEACILPPGTFTITGVEGQDAKPFSGNVKSFNAEKGWGFIQGEEIQATFGKDIFLHKRELGDQAPNVGDELHFTIEVGIDGQLTAKNVEPGLGFGGAPAPGPGGNRASPY